MKIPSDKLQITLTNLPESNKARRKAIRAILLLILRIVDRPVPIMLLLMTVLLMTLLLLLLLFSLLLLLLFACFVLMISKTKSKNVNHSGFTGKIF